MVPCPLCGPDPGPSRAIPPSRRARDQRRQRSDGSPRATRHEAGSRRKLEAGYGVKPPERVMGPPSVSVELPAVSAWPRWGGGTGAEGGRLTAALPARLRGAAAIREGVGTPPQVALGSMRSRRAGLSRRHGPQAGFPLAEGQAIVAHRRRNSQASDALVGSGSRGMSQGRLATKARHRPAMSVGCGRNLGACMPVLTHGTRPA